MFLAIVEIQSKGIKLQDHMVEDIEFKEILVCRHGFSIVRSSRVNPFSFNHKKLGTRRRGDADGDDRRRRCLR